jgi:hypothetical protein
MIKRKVLIFVCIIVTLLSSCTNTKLTASPTATNPPNPTGSIETAYPALPGSEAPTNSSNNQSAYPITGDNFTPVPVGVVPSPPQDAPEPDPGKASISGALYAYTIKQALPGTGFYLLPAVGPDKKGTPLAIVEPDPSKGDIIGHTDNTGMILMKDIPPGNYFLVVWAPLNWSLAQKSEADTSPMLIELSAGSRLALGVIYVSWP